jgi:hypothetical protein
VELQLDCSCGDGRKGVRGEGLWWRRRRGEGRVGR